MASIDAARRSAFAFLAAAMLVMAAPAVAGVRQQEVTVFAAASLTNALQDLGKAYEATTGVKVILSFASSSAVAKQIEAGAPADLFVSADAEWMDYLQRHGLIDAATRRNLLSNSLVLIAPAGSAAQLAIAPGFPLAQALGRDGRLSVGDPDFVPAGRYAHAALSQLGVWTDVADRLLRADNVRSALAFVSRGEAPLGIVYRTDVTVDGKVRIIGTFPAGSHPPIVYPLAVVKGAKPGAREFQDFLRTPQARALFEKYGFINLD
ncbi:MAG: molybdate ABC transporter substrate-binding protein [Sphingomonadales bacterium]